MPGNPTSTSSPPPRRPAGPPSTPRPPQQPQPPQAQASAPAARLARTQKYLANDEGFWLPNGLFHTALAQVRQEFEKGGQKVYSFRFVFSRNESPILRWFTVLSIRTG